MHSAKKKLQKESGKSILMAMLLLLVAAVVSVVIVTVALSSVMQINENRRSQQEYLTCISAAELVRDGINGSRYEHVLIAYTPKSRWYPAIESIEETTATAAVMKTFVEKASEKIASHSFSATDEVLLTENMTVSVSDVEPEKVTARLKLICTQSGAYEVQMNFEAKTGEDSQGYRMNMKVPISVTESQTQTEETFDWFYTYKVSTTTTTVTWGKGVIAKGWSE